MRTSVGALVLVTVLTTAGTASRASSDGPTGGGDDGARAVLSAAVEALGGSARLESLDDWMVAGRGRENLSAELQGLSASKPTWREHEETVAVLTSGAVAWERRTPRNDNSLRWRRFIYTPAGTGVIDWTSGSAGMRPSVAPERSRAALGRRIPHRLVREAAAAALVERRAPRTIDGAPHDVVRATLADGTVLDLAFARTPVVLKAAEYRMHIPGKGDTNVTWNWNRWTASPSLRWAPRGHSITVGDAIYEEVTYTRFEAGSADAARFMEIPDAVQARRRTPDGPIVPPAGPATGEVAPGVHVVRVRGYLAMFVEFRDFVLAVEAPESYFGLETIPAGVQPGSVTEEILAIVRKTIPDKPIRFAVVTHHHYDHLGGVRRFAAAGATILAATADVPAIAAALAARHTIAPDGWIAGQRASVQGVADSRTITDGDRIVEVISVGKNPHTDGNVFVWLPRERLIFQGDLFYYEEGAPFPPPGRGTMNRFFAKWLLEHGIAPKAIYGVHYEGAAAPDALVIAMR